MFVFTGRRSEGMNEGGKAGEVIEYGGRKGLPSLVTHLELITVHILANKPVSFWLYPSKNVFLILSSLCSF